jgi:DNA invertase Pin-like site-specific DNA recombinase
MRTAIYARCSTTDQNIGMQVSQLREFAERRGWTVVSEYTDQGISGTTDSRPALNRMLADAHKRRFDAILVWRLDRLGRSLRHLVNTLADLESIGVAFVSMMDSLGLSTPSGRFMAQMLAALAQFEREIIVQRVRAGIAHAKASGKHCSRPRLAEVNLSTVIARRAAGQSIRQIALELGTSVGTIHRMCSKPLSESASVSV